MCFVSPSVGYFQSKMVAVCSFHFLPFRGLSLSFVQRPNAMPWHGGQFFDHIPPNRLRSVAGEAASDATEESRQGNRLVEK